MPTVLTDVSADARLFNEEPFGPVAGVRGFDGLEDAIAEANRLSYGLAYYAFTRSLANADLLARRVEVGMLWVNTPAMPSAELPFGGIRDSGYRTEGGPRRWRTISTRAPWPSPTSDAPLGRRQATPSIAMGVLRPSPRDTGFARNPASGSNWPGTFRYDERRIRETGVRFDEASGDRRTTRRGPQRFSLCRATDARNRKLLSATSSIWNGTSRR